MCVILNENPNNTGKIIRFTNGTELELDLVKKICPAPANYGMGVVLKNSENHNGRFIFSYGHALKVFISDDEGETFKNAVPMKDGTEWNGATFEHVGMSSMFELPEAVGNFPKGTVISCGTSMTGPYGEKPGVDNGTKSSIHIFYSLDSGESFELLGYIDMERNLGLGVWEPFMLYEKETGKLFCYYSDDSLQEHDQKIVFKYSTDLINWVGEGGTIDCTQYKTLKKEDYPEPFDVIACDNPEYRPGMPEVVRMKNGDYFMVYEMYPGWHLGDFNGDVYCKISRDPGNWGDPADYGKPIKTVDGKMLASAPYVGWTPAGGENGMLIVSGRHMISGEETSVHKDDIFVSFDYGKNFTSFENPFDLNRRFGAWSGRHPIIEFSPDMKTLYYTNQICNDAGDGNEMWLARYRIKERKY